MKYIIDFVAILLIGDGVSKLLSRKSHNQFYQFKGAPQFYNKALEGLAQSTRFKPVYWCIDDYYWRFPDNND